MCLAIPGKVVETFEHDGCTWARSSSAASPRGLPGARARGAAGDYVLVHVGFALCRVDEAEAARIYRAARGAGPG